MDCSDARTWFPLLTLPPVGELADELQPAQLHLEQCAACRAAWQEEAAGDQELSQRMSAVRLPEHLSARLLQRVAAQSTLPLVRRPRHARRRSWLGATVAVLVIAGLIAPFLVQSFSQTSVSVATLVSLIHQNLDFRDWPAIGVREQPSGWPAGSQIAMKSSHGQTVAGVVLQVSEFQYSSPRGAELVSGTIWRVALDQIRDADAIPSLESAQIQYGPDHGLLIWRENATVYVVMMEGRSLEGLQNKLIRSRSLA